MIVDRLDSNARTVLVEAFREANGLSHPVVGPEHLLLAVGSDAGDLARQAFDFVGVSQERLRAEIAAASKQPSRTGRRRALSPAGREVLKNAGALGEPDIRPEHLLLAILVESASLAVDCLRAQGVEPRAVRDAVIGLS